MIQKTSLTYPSIKSQLVVNSENNYSLLIEPLLPGYGHTLGNSLRRVLLSSVPGFAVVRIRINDITHEYQPIEGVLEDAMNLVLNLKSLRARILTDDDSVVISLKKSKKGDITAKDFLTEKRVEIVNPELYICHLSKDMDFTIEVEIKRGVGYLPTEKINFAGNLNPQDILVDAVFSPVTNCSLRVEKVRVGDQTDFDKLELDFTTDGTQNGQEVVEFSLDFIHDLFQQTKSALGISSTSSATVDKPKAVKKASASETKEIDLEEEILGILEKNGITTLAELTERVGELDDFAGMTKKRLEKTKSYLESLKA